MSEQKIIFSLQGVGKIIPTTGKYILKDIYLSFFYGAKIGIIGANGSGKSTLLKIIAGRDTDYVGHVQMEPGYTIGLLEQEPLLDNSKTVKEVVSEAVAPVLSLLQQFEQISNRFSEPMDEQQLEKLTEQLGAVQEKIDAVNGWEIESRLQRAMDALNCPDGDTPIHVLSGGERRRVALCRLLLTQPDILLLDEPTNHLDAESVQWLEQHLQQYRGTVIAVTHDRYFLDNVAGWILELDRGEGIPWKGNYSSWLEQKQLRLQQEEKAASKRQKALQRELEWIRMSPKARQAKGKARLANYERMLQQEVKQQEEKLELYIPPGPRLGNKVIEAHGVSKAFGDTLLFENLNFSLPQNGIVGVIGPNGCGKTTLFRMIVGEEKPDSGHFVLGETVRIAYVDQLHAQLDPEKTVWETISNGHEYIEIGHYKVNSRAYVARFNFSGLDQQKKIAVLSGGERNRLHLALTLRHEANVLLLDEPTNDLDVHTLRALEEALDQYAGCAVIISHDRWFLDRVATHILAFEGEGRVYWFEGGFSDYEENKRKRLGDQAFQKFKYKKLVKE
ncbi:MAG: energy-dependent translational throttle protein EttA [Chitinophagales bacterium]|nr:energy-dependent translational throttle protein EttA [Chitinophagales bacterium]MDW8428389.1 energy-dependent translational throttle protein EttA [Chitinophagales bacterium]